MNPAQEAADGEIDVFSTPVDERALADLAERLGRTRWPDPSPTDPWVQGVPLEVIRDLCDHWLNGYDWAARAALLDRFPQFRTTIDGVGIHFVHARSPEPRALPLVMTHGWPGSIVEFQQVIGPLTDPVAHGGDAADAFHVVCPSLPGYAWSDAPTEPGWGTLRVARAWALLMARLGYDRYGAQGGDWGAMVTTALGGVDPHHVVGIHLNMPLAFGDGNPADQTEVRILEDFQQFRREGSGYQQLQSTRPQTLGYGLTDSPAGQAAWILEKLWSWSDHDGDLAHCFSQDQILDNIMLYWLPGAAATSARMYWEQMHPGPEPWPAVAVPVGCSIFPGEMLRTSRRWAEMEFADLRWFNEVDRGGHFAAFEQPDLFVDEVRACFQTMR